MKKSDKGLVGDATHQIPKPSSFRDEENFEVSFFVCMFKHLTLGQSQF